MKNGTGLACSLAGCETITQPSSARGWCAMHYTRWLRHGDPLYKVPKKREQMNQNGYRVVCLKDHPLADAGGRVYEHRLVLHAVIGDGAHACHWCGTPVAWGDGLYADHLDDNPVNNTPANLVPSCNGCNINRSRADGSARRTRTNA